MATQARDTGRGRPAVKSSSSFAQRLAAYQQQSLRLSDETISTQADARIATVVSVVGVTLIYFLFFKRIRHPLMIVAALLVGILFEMGSKCSPVRPSTSLRYTQDERKESPVRAEPFDQLRTGYIRRVKSEA